jgi:RNA polymerase sigma-70 factor (ECF subfamily)
MKTTFTTTTKTETTPSFVHAQAMSDEEVVRRICAGETSLYEVLMQRYNGRLRRTTGKYLQNDAEVDDIVQEAHLRAFLHLDQFNGYSSFATWLTRIAINQAFTYLRTRSRLEEIAGTPEGYDGESKAFRSPVRDPEQHTHNQELRIALNSAMNALPTAYRMVFELKEIEQLSTMEVVNRLGITETCAKSRLHRARKQLRKNLREWVRRDGIRPPKLLCAARSTVAGAHASV